MAPLIRYSICADDNFVILRLVKRWLENAGFACIAVDSADVALLLIENDSVNTFSILITDLDFQGKSMLSGLDLVRSVRKRERNNMSEQQLPIVVLSGSSEYSKKLHDMESLNVFFVEKPLREKDFQMVLADIFADG